MCSGLNVSERKKNREYIHAGNHDDDLDNPAFKNLWKFIKFKGQFEVKIRIDKNIDVFGIKDNFYKGKDTATNEFVVVREISTEKTPEDLIDNDIFMTRCLKSEKVTTVLQIREPVDEEKCVILIYDFYEYTFRQYIDCNKDTISEDVFKSIVKDLIDAISIVHSKNIVIKNISLDNVALPIENNELTPKIFNLSMAAKYPTEEEYLNDIRDFGILLLSVFQGAEDAATIAAEIQLLQNYNQKFKHICEKVKDFKWMKAYNIKLFLNLIICLIEVKLYNDPIISDFKKHIYFWEDDELIEFFNLINGRINLSTDASGDDEERKKIVADRVKVLNAKMPKFDDFKDKLDEDFLVFLDGKYTWNELIRVIRNKIVHKDDNTDSEHTSSKSKEPLKRGESQKSKKPNKDPQALKKLAELFKENGNALNYFRTKLEDLIYYLFIHFQLHGNHLIIGNFYVKSFLFEVPEEAYDRAIAEVRLAEAIENAKKQNEGTGTSGQSNNSCSTNLTPNISATNRNEKYRTDSRKSKNTSKFTRKNYNCI